MKYRGNDGGYPVIRISNNWRLSHSWWPARKKMEPQSYNLKDLNSANNLNELGNGFFLRAFRKNIGWLAAWFQPNDILIRENLACQAGLLKYRILWTKSEHPEELQWQHGQPRF